MKNIQWKPVLSYAFFWSLAIGAAIQIILNGMPDAAGGSEVFTAFAIELLITTLIVFPVGIGAGILVRKNKELRESILQNNKS